MNLFELFVKIGVDDQASSRISKIASGLGKGLKTAAKVGVAAVGAASTAIVALGKIGLDYNKQIETYTTNFEVMMGDAEAAARKVEELKEMGAKTPFELGDLANATQTLLAFNVSADDSTGVLSRLGDISLGNVQKLESLTRAYGKMNASQKVTLEDINMMIDAGFNPLLIVAEETGKTMTEVYDDISKGKVSFEQIEDAISKATSAGGQFYQGMQKASQTTEGLISTLKDNATALVGEVYMPISEGLTKTVLPSAINAINTLSEAFKENGINGMIAAAGKMLGSLVNFIVEYAPKVVDTAVTLVNSLIQGLRDNQESIATGAIQIVTSLATGILNMLPQIVALGLDLIVSLANGIAESLPTLIPTIISVVLQIVNTLTSPETLSQLLDAALTLILALAEGLLSEDSINGIIDAIFMLIDNIITFLTDPENIMKLVDAAVRLVVAIAEGLISAVGRIQEKADGLIDKFKTKFEETDWLQLGKDIINSVKDGIVAIAEKAGTWGKDLIDNFIGGIKEKWEKLKKTVSDVAQSVKDFLGFSEPKKGPLSNFHTYAPDMMDLFAKGIRDNEDVITDQIEKSFDFGERTMKFGAEYGGGYSTGASGMACGGNSFGDVYINIDGANFDDPHSLAVAVAEELQNMTDRRLAVYA